MSQNTGPTGPSNPAPPVSGTITINPKTVTSGGIIIGGTVPVAPAQIQWINYGGNGVWGYIEAIPSTPAKAKKDDRDGCDCAKCGDFYPYAESNQDDGTLICYRCRMGW